MFMIPKLLLLLLTARLLPGDTEAAEKKDPPNILFIAVDDLKPMLNCYGESQIISPNIDALAANGTMFMKNYCQQAVCGPSRASLLTGLRPDKTGVWDLKTRMRDVHPDILALPQYFRMNGYTTVAFGKIYDPRCVDDQYDEPSWTVPYIRDPDFELPKGIKEPMFGHYQDPETRAKGEALMKEAAEKGLRNYQQKKYGLERLKPVTESADVPDNAYYDGMMNDHAMAELEKLAGENKPFFLAVGYKKPHLPFVSPKKYWDLYDRDKIDVAVWQKWSKNGPAIAYHKNGEIHSYTDIGWVDDKIPIEKQKEIIHGYYAAVSYIDALIGELTAKLKELGLANNTIIILWGDHGWHLGDHGLWAKHSNFEQATRAPLIIDAPNMKKGLKINTPTDFIDIFPTLCELSGLDIPEQLEGTSLVPILSGEKSRVKEFALSQYPRWNHSMGYSLRTDRYRYTAWYGDGYLSTQPYDGKKLIARELYDYQTDPNETVNLVDDPAYKKIADELSAKLVAFLKSQEKK